MQLLTIKPIITVANSEKDGETAIGNEPALGINVRQEYDISQIPESERQEYIKELGLSESGLDRIIETAYRALNLITFIIRVKYFYLFNKIEI